MWLTRALPLLPLALGTGCGSWPRHANLPADDGSVPASEAEDAIEVSWEDGYLGDATDGEPVVLGALLSGHGYYAEDELTSIGWDPDLVPPTDADCNGETVALAFPPLATGGSYTGDIDWRGLEVGEDAKLCAGIEIVVPSDLEGLLTYDFVPYLLSACDDPIEAFTDDQGAVLGFDKSRANASWSVDVTAGQRISVGLAGLVAGETLEVVVPWRLALSLVPTEAAACPSLPEAL